MYILLDWSWSWSEAPQNYLQWLAQHLLRSIVTHENIQCAFKKTQHKLNPANWKHVKHCSLFIVISALSQLVVIYIHPAWLLLMFVCALPSFYIFYFFDLAFKDDTHTFLTMNCVFYSLIFFLILRRHLNCTGIRKSSINQNLTGVFTFKSKPSKFSQLTWF